LARITPCLENGKTGIVDFLENDEIGWGSTEFIVMRGKKFISPFFVYCLARQQDFREFAIQSMIGSSGRQRVVETILADFTLVIPDEMILQHYHKIVEPLFRQLKENADQSATLAAIRDALLPKLMNGELDV
jgi:type I restriction enzyme, S subunit